MAVGTCSICGGVVFGHRGAYHSILPPPPDECADCGAVRADQMPVIPMRTRQHTFRSEVGTVDNFFRVTC